MTFRPDPKPIPKEKRKDYRIRKITPKKKKEKEELHFEDKIFYDHIWRERKHVCEMCNKELGFQLYWNYMHHILEKGRRAYAHLRHERLNIIVVCQNCHDMFHSANLPNDFTQIIIEAIQIFKSKELLK